MNNAIIENCTGYKIELPNGKIICDGSHTFIKLKEWKEMSTKEIIVYNGGVCEVFAHLQYKDLDDNEYYDVYIG